MDARQFYKNLGTNFMTPDPISYRDSKHFYIEVAEGEFLRSMIYGVTVRNHDGKDPYNLSKCFHNKQEALDYAHQIVLDDRDGEYDD